MSTMTMKVDGMSCGHCVMSVERALSEIEGVKVEQVKIGSAVVQFDAAKVSASKIAEAVEDAGYAVVESATA